MHSPVLSLSRSHPVLPPRQLAEKAAAENMRQLIQLRWIAVAGQAFTIWLVHFGFSVELPLAEMFGVVVLLGAVNALSTFALPRHHVRDVEVMLALMIDLGALTLQLYFSGGATNPFIALYLLQVVLGAILLPVTLAGLLMLAASCCYGLLSLSHVPLHFPASVNDDGVHLFIVGRLVSFVMVTALLVYFIARIRGNLRARDSYLAYFRQKSVEEEAIVRMGLFASGAAHELGTPLGTLSVILSDWPRMPNVANDPSLLAEVKEMQSEVQRCKAIVSDILRSAGEPRGEEMESAPAAPFIDAVVAEWQAANPNFPLAYDRNGAAKVVIAVDPSLRQAITNLLDNAAEASPDGAIIQTIHDRDSLVILVSDWGPGFPPKALESVGKLYQSTKGAGHGIGLFLAANVTRQLGGSLEARNGDGGGAEVRLILPLVSDGEAS